MEDALVWLLTDHKAGVAIGLFVLVVLFVYEVYRPGPPPPQLRIILEGGIGVGKSTLAGELAAMYRKKYPRASVCVHEENGDDWLVGAFYMDRQKNAFAMQLHMAMIRSTAFHACKADICVADRGMLGNMSFLRVAKKNGYISDEEYDYYNKCVNGSLDGMCGNKVPVVLHVTAGDIRTQMKRIQKRGRETERGIKAVYLRQLDRTLREIVDEFHDGGGIVREFDNSKDRDTDDGSDAGHVLAAIEGPYGH